MNRIAKNTRRIAALLLAVALLLAGAPSALAASFTAVVTAGSMQVYRDAELSDKLGKLNKNSVVRVSGYSDGVARITFNGVTGYAMSADMDRIEDVAKKALLVANSKIYASPNRNSVNVLGKKGLRLYVIAAKNGWAMVEMNGNVGYVETDRLVKANGKWQRIEDTARDEDIEFQAASSGSGKGTTYTTRVKLAMYKAATTTSKKVTTLKKYTKVTVLHSNKTWAYVKAGGKTGFCQMKYLKKGTVANSPQSVAKVLVNKLPVYKSSSVKSKKLGTLKKGLKVYMIRWNSRWAYIELNGHRGYTATKGLKRVANVAPAATPKPSTTPKPGAAIPAVVSASSATVYKKASSSSAKLGTLKKGTQVSILSATGKWARIKAGGKTGFCLMAALTKKETSGIPDGFKKTTYTATVVASGAKAYKAPNTAASSATLGLGASVKVVAVGDGWVCLSRNGSNAYVALNQISNATYPAAKDGSGQLKTVLKSLLKYGYYDGVPDTDLTADATAAIKRFQAACGMNKTGTADEILQRILFGGFAPRSSMLSKALTKGDKNSRVTRLQTRLYSLSYLSKSTSIDGDYGSTTASAVSLFQKANGLVATGGADLATLKALYTTGAKSLPAGTRAADAPATTGGGTSTYMTYMPGNTASKVTKYSAKLTNAKKLEYAIYVASTKLTCPYVYGAMGPDRFDCSGLTTYCFKQIGTNLQRTAYQHGYDTAYTKIEAVTALRRGDLVFFNTVSDSDLCDHVGIYLGDGYFIHASSGGHKVVVSQLLTGYYNRVFSWGRRVLK